MNQTAKAISGWGWGIKWWKSKQIYKNPQGGVFELTQAVQMDGI